MKNFKLKFSEYMQNISRSKSFGRFGLIVWGSKLGFKTFRVEISGAVLDYPATFSNRHSPGISKYSSSAPLWKSNQDQLQKVQSLCVPVYPILFK